MTGDLTAVLGEVRFLIEASHDTPSQFTLPELVRIRRHERNTRSLVNSFNHPSYRGFIADDDPDRENTGAATPVSRTTSTGVSTGAAPAR